MNTIVEHINSAGHIFVEFALPMLVQSSVLIVILLLADLALRKKVKAVFRYCIWMLILVKLILPTSLSSPLSLGYWFGDHLAYVAESRTAAAPEAEALEPALADMLHIIEPVPIEEGRPTPAVLPMMPDVEPAEAEPVSPPAVSVTPVTWQGVVFLLWLAVVMALGLLLLQRAMFVRGLVVQAREANALMNGALEYCRKCMGVKRKIGLKVSANATSPAVCGLFRPVILLPHKLAPSLGSSHLRAVLLHELAHIRRGDLWVNLVQTVLQIAYFYNPLLWLANAMIRRVREQAIDETVLVAMGEKAQQYPQTLVNVAKLAFKRPVLSLRLIGVVESKSALAGRIKHILNRPMPKSAKLGIVGLVAVIIAGCVLLPMARKEPHIPPTSTIDASGRIVDKIDYAFVNDPAVIGTWKSVDFVRAIEDFESSVKHWPGDLYLKEMFIFEDGRTGGPWTWTKGLIIHPGDKTAAKYHIKEIDGSTYMFFEWKSGDYTIRHMKPRYYVLKKVEKRISPETAEPAMKPTDAKYVATLSNGVTVELVGICEDPTKKGQKWWRPNGITMGEPEYELKGKQAFKYPCLGYLLNFFPYEDISYESQIDLEHLFFSSGPVTKQGQVVVFWGENQTLKTALPGRVEISVKVADGDWTMGKPGENDVYKEFTNLPNGKVIILSGLRPNPDKRVHTKTLIDATTTEFDVDIKLECITRDGKHHKSWDEGTLTSKENLVQCTFGFWPAIENIEKIYVKYRDFSKVTFKNVSLRPGAKTDVQVEVDDGPVSSTLPAAMVGTWFFDNPGGDDEQMAIFPDGRVVVLYSNGHKDETGYIDGFVELSEYGNAKCKMVVQEDGTLVQYFDSGGSTIIGKRWKRIDPQPRTNPLRLLTGPDSVKTDVQVEVEGLEVGPAPIVRAVDNKATLASGVSVELLGLTYVPLKDQPWWKPNGSLIEQPPFDNVSFDPSRDPNHDQFAYYAVAMKLKGKAPDEIRLIKWNFTDALYAGTTSAYLDDKGVYKQNIRAAVAKFPKDVETTALRLGFASGDWQTLVAGRHYGFYRKGEDSIVVRTPERAGGPFGVRPQEKGLHISVTYNITDRDFRVVAVDKDGKVHFSTRSGSSGTGNLRQTTASFPDLTRDELQEYRFQVRPHEWVEFRNIALRPGKEAVALTEKRRAAGREELEKWLGQGRTRRIREQILVLRGCRIFKEMEAWALAIRELVSIGKPAVPELLAELRRAQRWPTQSTVAFTLRAIADPRAVPVLIEVLGRVEYRGEYGIHLKDPPLSVFMLENQHRPAPDRGRKQKDPQITIGCPVIEITAALEKITGHTEGHEHYGHKAVAELGSDAPRDVINRRIQEIVREVAGRWQKWWQQNKQKTDVKVETPVEAALGWLKLVDDGDYGKSFDEMAELYRGAVSKADWEKTMDLYGKGFGKVVSRKVSSKRRTRYLPTGPAGEYVIIEFESSFEYKSKVTETVTLMRDRDGVWRVTRYFIE